MRTRLWVPTLVLLLAAGVPTAAARRERPITIRTPRFRVEPRSDREIVTAVRIPRRTPFDIAGMEIDNRGGNPEFSTHHFLAYVYTGPSGVTPAALRNRVSDSGSFSDFELRLIGGAQTVRKRQVAPAGLAIRLAPVPRRPGGRKTDVWIILNSHWRNGSDRAQHASVRVKLIPAARPIKRYLEPIFEVSANAALEVPPGTVRSTEETTAILNLVLGHLGLPALTDAWGPGEHGLEPYGVHIGGARIPTGPVCVTFITAHLHQRGTLFAVDFVDADDQVRNGPPTPGTENPYTPGRHHLFVSRDYADPAELVFDPPRLLLPGQRFRYACWHDNGVTRHPKLGCEEAPGLRPGVSIATATLTGGYGPARPCFRRGWNPEECPTDRGTGYCVDANLVFGNSADDDMCILPGGYYDANPEAPPGHECDLEPLPPLA